MKKATVNILLALVILFCLLAFVFVSYNNNARVYNAEKFAGSMDTRDYAEFAGQAGDVAARRTNSVADKAAVSLDAPSATGASYVAAEPSIGNNSSYATLSANPEPVPKANCFPRDRLDSADLLPKDAANSRWAAANPSGQGSVGDANLLSSGWHIGINTISSSLRNASHDLRSTPPNPQIPVSPFLNSTVEPDLLRKPLEIGGEY